MEVVGGGSGVSLLPRPCGAIPRLAVGGGSDPDQNLNPIRDLVSKPDLPDPYTAHPVVPIHSCVSIDSIGSNGVFNNGGVVLAVLHL